jgi:hypothetical protein
MRNPLKIGLCESGRVIAADFGPLRQRMSAFSPQGATTSKREISYPEVNNWLQAAAKLPDTFAVA